jgi:hypothetical protein
MSISIGNRTVLECYSQLIIPKGETLTISAEWSSIATRVTILVQFVDNPAEGQVVKTEPDGDGRIRMTFVNWNSGLSMAVPVPTRVGTLPRDLGQLEFLAVGYQVGDLHVLSLQMLRNPVAA